MMGTIILLAMAPYYHVAHFILFCKFAFFLTESLNTDMVKAENPEAVVATEPQGKYISTSLSLHPLYIFSTGVTEAQFFFFIILIILIC